MRVLKKLALFAAILLQSTVSQSLDAPPALVPPDLSPGDTFFIVFAGSDTLDGTQTSATYAAYAALVAANNPDTASINGWTTLFGHDDATLVTTSAFGGDTSSPIYNTNGDRVADNRAGFFSNSQSSAIAYDETGTANANDIWTGFQSTGASVGIGDDSLGGNDSLNDGCLAGDPTVTTGQWATNTLEGGAGCAGASLGLYVLSPLLTVPGSAVPVPAIGTYALLALILAMLFVTWRARSLGGVKLN